MSQKWIREQIKALETKAKNKKLSMHKVCVLAGMQPAMWWHWKKERYSPRMKSFQKLHDVVDGHK